MPYQTIIDQGKTAFESLKSLDTEALFADPGNLPPWNGAGIDDFKNAFESLIESIESIYENDVLDDLPFNIVSGFTNQLNGTLQHCSQFQNNKNQQHFYNAFQHVENLRTNIQTWGLSSLSILGGGVQNKINQINEELTSIINKKAEIEQLKTNVESLIKPGVAGSLSKSFSDRKQALEKKENKWFWASLITAVVAVAATVIIVLSIVGFFEGASQTTEQAEAGKNVILWSTLALRLGILLPIYSVFGLAFTQYTKERNLEEEYAHRSAVATSLPNYGDLAVDEKVKDQILSEASKVIFNSPTKHSSKQSENSSVIPGMQQLNDLVKNLQKFVRSSGSES